VAVDLFATDSVKHADVVLPAAGFAEKSGTTTNIEGRISRLGQKVTPPGTARPDWMIAVELATRLGDDLGFESLDDIWTEIERVAPAHRGVTLAFLGDADQRDGVVVPLGAHEAQRAPRTTAETDQADRVIEAIETHAAASQGEGIVAVAAAGLAHHEPDATEAEARAAHPPLLTFAPDDRVGPAPRTDAYALRMVSTRSLYDLGAGVQRCRSMAHLAPGPRVRMNPHDLERLGLTSGDRVRMVSSRNTAVLSVTAWSGVPRGSVSITFNQPGEVDAADIIDVDTAVTEIRLETVGA
jgi:predicted molibdopterin-dependent oxidoreductase YjgC